mmetsp:Transcript_30036/g.49621  ORF Transcript_30036/g.49621 Transcript_30036/m.49621 type:complete len:992 (-) Transcript_30036:108-3083(-)
MKWSILTFLLLTVVVLAQGASVTVWDDIADGFSTGEDPVQSSCLANDYTFQHEGGDYNYLQMSVTKWHNGGLQFGCMKKDSNWQCISSCFGGTNNPNFMDYEYLTFLAKNEEDDLDPGCVPSVSLVKRYPMYGSSIVNITGDYVKRQTLVADEWRQVVIPTAAFATEEWPGLEGVKNLWFRTCGTGFQKQPIYKVANIQLTNDPPVIEPEHNPLWTHVEDSAAIEDPGKTCMTHLAPYSSTTQDTSLYDFFTAATDPWRGVGLLFGCQGKDSNWQCNHSCFPWDGTNANFDDDAFVLTFLAKVTGDFRGDCKPALSLSGGGWPRFSSHKLALEGNYVDAGELVPDEWRRVAIRLGDFATAEWDLSNVFSLYFQSCGTEHAGAQPTYMIAQMELTDIMPELTVIPPASLELATHRLFHTNWYPIFGEGRDDKTWLHVSGGQWPSEAVQLSDYEGVVVIPEGETVTFSAYDTTKYDKVIVYGTLIIVPDSSNVLLRPGTLIVESSGVVDISTDVASAYTVTIEIDAALDRVSDPEETTVGVLSLGGTINVTGNSVATFMGALQKIASAGSSTVTIVGSMAGEEWNVGDELVLPDTQEGLDVAHWNFPQNMPNGYTDQTEIVTISALTVEADGNTLLSLSAPLAYEHSIGAHAGHLSRSITFITAPNSADRGHIMYTAGGGMDFRYVRMEEFGRTSINTIDNTEIEDLSGLKFEEGFARMSVTYQGTNQLARYVFHAHHSRVESYLHGSVILFTPRNGCVHHDSRVHSTNNVVVGAEGSGIFLEDGTETGTVLNNFLVGTGGGTRGGDDSRFSTANGKDMGHGGFGVWARGQYATIQSNHAEGHFGLAPYAYFVHPNFIQNLKVPDVPGTAPELVGKSLVDMWHMLEPESLNIQVFGSFQDNTAFGTWPVGLDLSYFGENGSEFVGTDLIALAYSGRQISTTHTSLISLQGGSIEAIVPENTIVGVWCNNGGPLEINYEDIPMHGVFLQRGGNC